jgi:ribosomal protein S27E
VNIPSAQTLLAIWEQGLRSLPVYRALLLLSATHSEPLEQLAQLAIGERNRRLIMLRQTLFGSQAETVVDCPLCKERLEFTLPLSSLITETSGEKDFTFHSGDYRLAFRLPNSLDLLNLPNDIVMAREHLLTQCLSDVQRQGKSIAAKNLPKNILAKLSEQMSKADPKAVLELRLECPGCQHAWTAIFDSASFLWCELDHWAKHMLLAIHHLASAYSWREEDILKMSTWRRQAYLEMLS